MGRVGQGARQGVSCYRGGQGARQVAQVGEVDWREEGRWQKEEEESVEEMVALEQFLRQQCELEEAATELGTQFPCVIVQKYKHLR